ncbi:hypothetical protein [Clostridium fungisolvens]|uniref:Uncharacterized protein n=1 Tax=Clostridium fungisolvens TaxID=1604897 RepID=A0A6V8SFV6_9CLOT|nr:hypothetical protein [Clostridium fungisolvens]GFP75482.1 hypothetical protein bsdtw1_01562 [Clostridium fungisolvens]
MKNKYKTASVLFSCFSVFLIIAMLTTTLIDYQNFLQHPEYSTPFSLNLVFKSVTYGVPTVASLVLSFIFKKKQLDNR